MEQSSEGQDSPNQNTRQSAAPCVFMICGAKPFDSSPPWLSPYGRAKARPNSSILFVAYSHTLQIIQAHLGTGLKDSPIAQRERRCLLPVSSLPRQIFKIGRERQGRDRFRICRLGHPQGKLVWGVFLGSFFVRAKNEQKNHSYATGHRPEYSSNTFKTIGCNDYKL